MIVTIKCIFEEKLKSYEPVPALSCLSPKEYYGVNNYYTIKNLYTGHEETAQIEDIEQTIDENIIYLTKHGYTLNSFVNINNKLIFYFSQDIKEEKNEG